MMSTTKRFLALLLALAMVFSLGATAFADELDDLQGAAQELPEPQLSETVEPITVELPYGKLKLNAGETTNVSARVDGEGGGATYTWLSSDKSVVTASGIDNYATLTGVGAGSAVVTFTVTAKDGRTQFAAVNVTVTAAATPVTVSGGTSVTAEEGSSKNLTATVSGGSGSYEYAWDSDRSVAFISESMRNNATVYIGNSGNGYVSLTVYDAEDRTNNATTRWTFTVEDSTPATAPTLEMNRGSVDIGAGATASLMLSATGGSGNYDYYWKNDNPAAVTLTPNGATADFRAAATVLPGANRAEISATAVDKTSGLISNVVTCVVTVSAGSATYNYSGNATVGGYFDMNAAATAISDSFRSSFGNALSGTASVRFTSPSSAIGSIRFQNGTAVQSGTSYTYYTLQTLLFNAVAAGTFTTAYTITDGGNTISGTITLTATGSGIPISGASLNYRALNMYTYASQYLTLAVSPISATYSVTWSSSNTRIVTVSGGGNSVTLSTNGNTGSAIITATIYDASGKTSTCTCTVTVTAPSRSAQINDVSYSTSMTVTLGSDYYGSKLADSMVSRFQSMFNAYPTESDTITFSTLGNSRFGTMYTRDGTPAQANRNYTFRDWIDMYFVPSAAGTYTLNYTLRHGNKTMRGDIKIVVQASALTVTMSPSALRMAPYSTQYLTLSVAPAATSYRVQWTSSNTKVATVTGSNASAVVTSVSSGTATITAIVTDPRGIEIRRSCTVLVTNSGSVFNPSVSTMLGIPYVGTGTSEAMRSQFSALYGSALGNNAIIRFASAGNTDVAVMRLADGSMIRPDTNYTLAQYVAMYTQPVSQGTYSVPYTLTYGGKELNGTVSVVVGSAAINSYFNLPSAAPVSFADKLGASNGGMLFAESIRNSVGGGWSYIRFGSAANGAGTLYLDRNYTTIGPNVDITPAMMQQLYYVPSAQGGVFIAPYTVYTSAGTVLANGELTLTLQTSGTFTDVPASAYYASAVNWAVGKGITSGTSATTFSPAMTVTRGQAVTFLWRAAGMPKAIGAVNTFADVKDGAYYYDAVLWAIQMGITNGTSPTSFSPDAQLNRDQLLTFLCRASGSYADGADWSQQAVNWATTHGLLTGVPGTFVAASACPRSDTVYYLWKGLNG